MVCSIVEYEILVKTAEILVSVEKQGEYELDLLGDHKHYNNNFEKFAPIEIIYQIELFVYESLSKAAELDDRSVKS